MADATRLRWSALQVCQRFVKCAHQGLGHDAADPHSAMTSFLSTAVLPSALAVSRWISIMRSLSLRSVIVRGVRGSMRIGGWSRSTRHCRASRRMSWAWLGGWIVLVGMGWLLGEGDAGEVLAAVGGVGCVVDVGAGCAFHPFPGLVGAACAGEEV